jgi:hypothetical protein
MFDPYYPLALQVDHACLERMDWEHFDSMMASSRLSEGGIS